MSLSQGFPSTFSGTQETNEVLHNLDNETKKIYNDVNNIMSASGHRHTGNGSDGAKIDYSTLENAPAVYPLNDLATSSVSLWSSQKTQNEINDSKAEAITQATIEAVAATAIYAEAASDSSDDAAESANSASLAAQSIAEMNFPTCALMRADLAHNSGVVALVYADRYVAGSNTYTITTNFAATSIVVFDGITFTAVASGATGNQFNVGASNTISATNLAAVINANTTLNTRYSASASANVITVVDIALGGGNTPINMSVTGTGAITNGTAVESTSNGIWIKQGSSGSGYWQKSLFTPPVANESIITQKIAPASVTHDKMAFNAVGGQPSKNLFNKDDVTTGYYVSSANGNLLTGASYYASAYIAVTPNTTYTISNTSNIQQFALYNASKVYTSGNTGTATAKTLTFTTGSSDYYIRISIYTGYLNYVQLEAGLFATEYVSYTNHKLLAADIYDKIPDTKLSFLPLIGQPSKNLFNKSTVTAGYYVSAANGNLLTGASYYASDYIPVLPSTTYTISNTANIQQLALYNASRVYTSGNNGTVTEKTLTFTTGSSDYYIRISVYTGHLDYTQLELGSGKTQYTTYGGKVTTAAIPIKSVLIVAKSGGDYTSITEALKGANDSILNPVSIIVMPGVYYEKVYLRDRYVTIIGVDKRLCAIRDDFGEYGAFPVNLGPGSNLSNLSIISTHDSNPVPVAEGYAVHFDYAGSGNSYIENCIIKTKQNAAIGIGMHSDQTLTLRGCEIIQEEETSGGALLMHNYQLSGAVNQKFILDNCRITSDYGNVLRIIDANHASGGTADDARDTVVSFYNNILWSKEIGKTNVIEVTPPLDGNSFSGYIKITGDSFGNNIAVLNK